MGTTKISRQAQPLYPDVADADELYTTRMPSSTRRYRPYDTCDDQVTGRGSFIQPRASRSGQTLASRAVNPSVRVQRSEQRSAPRRTLVMLILGAVTAVILIMLLSAFISWWQGVMDNIHYGYPRVSQLDAVVGHNDSQTNQTHFIFLNLHGHIEIIEIPGGDASHTHVFMGPTLVGQGQDLIPVTGEIRNEDGRIDLIVHIQDQQIVFVNDGTTFHQQ